VLGPNAGMPVELFTTGDWAAHPTAYSPDDKQMAMATQIAQTDSPNRGENQTGTFVVWDLGTGRESERFLGLPGVRPGERSRNALVWTAEGPFVAESSGAIVCPFVFVYDPRNNSQSDSLVQR